MPMEATLEQLTYIQGVISNTTKTNKLGAVIGEDFSTPRPEHLNWAPNQ